MQLFALVGVQFAHCFLFVRAANEKDAKIKLTGNLSIGEGLERFQPEPAKGSGTQTDIRRIMEKTLQIKTLLFIT